MDLSNRIASVLSDLLSRQFNAKITIVLGDEKMSQQTAKTHFEDSLFASVVDGNISGIYQFSNNGDLLNFQCGNGGVASSRLLCTQSSHAKPEPIATSVKMFCSNVQYRGEVKRETVYNDYCNYCETTGWRPVVDCAKFFSNFHAVMRDKNNYGEQNTLPKW